MLIIRSTSYVYLGSHPRGFEHNFNNRQTPHGLCFAAWSVTLVLLIFGCTKLRNLRVRRGYPESAVSAGHSALGLHGERRA